MTCDHTLKYAIYAQAIAPHIQWFKDMIQETSDKKVRVAVADVAKEMGPEFEKKSDKELYWGLKTVLFYDGIVVTIGKSKMDGSTVLIMRCATPEDSYPKTISDFKCQRLIIIKDVIKIMEDVKNLTSEDGLEHGFSLLYGEDCRIFPTELQTGLEGEMCCPDIPMEGYIIFGMFHTHTGKNISEQNEEYKKLLIKYNVHIMPSPDDVINTIDQYLNEKEFNHSAMIILSDIDNKGLIMIPRRNIPDTTYENILNILIEKIGEIHYIFNDLVFDLFYIFEFYVPFEGDMNIEYTNGEYKLEGIKESKRFSSVPDK